MGIGAAQGGPFLKLDSLLAAHFGRPKA
ncbi:hypothetical protein PMI14_05657, partial [Acidovorax sp. CF316]